MLDRAQRARKDEAEAFYSQLSPMCPLIAGYIAKHKDVVHIFVVFRELSNNGKLAYYSPEEGQAVLAKRHTSHRSPYVYWFPAQAQCNPFCTQLNGKDESSISPSQTPLEASALWHR